MFGYMPLIEAAILTRHFNSAGIACWKISPFSSRILPSTPRFYGFSRFSPYLPIFSCDFPSKTYENFHFPTISLGFSWVLGAWLPHTTSARSGSKAPHCRSGSTKTGKRLGSGFVPGQSVDWVLTFPRKTWFIYGLYMVYIMYDDDDLGILAIWSPHDSICSIFIQDGPPQWCERWFINHEIIPIN